MTSHLNVPVTPERKRTRPGLSAYSPIEANLDCTPESSERAKSLKRKASDIGDQVPPRHSSAFLEWRLGIIKHEMEAIEATYKAYDEATEFFKTSAKSKVQYLEEMKVELEELNREQITIIKQRRFFEEDLSDATDSLSEAYIKELQISWYEASGVSNKALKQSRLGRKEFKKAVAEYYGAQQDRIGDTLYYCHALHEWIGEGSVKCAHIVPFSFDSKELSYMFGADEAALESPRNGLMLHKTIEKAFDSGNLAIVPDGSVEATPVEWKIVVLNPNMGKDPIHKNYETNVVTKWSDLDGRRLAFQNSNRPARRYLYFRYTMAWMHAERKSYPDFKVKVPAGSSWASPDKPSGYLRKSILQDLALKIGDLPQDLLEAGQFEDADTASKVNDEIGRLTMPSLISNQLEGKKEVVDRDESDEDESDYDDEEQEGESL